MQKVTLTYNPASAIASSLMDTIRNSGVFKIEEETHYNPEILSKVENGRKNLNKGVSIKTEDLWK